MATSFEGYEPRLRANRKPSAIQDVLPAPEDVFLAWLLALPADADVASAARREIASLDRRAVLPAAAARLRALLVQATRPATPRRRARR